LSEIHVLGTPLRVTTYAALTAELQSRSREWRTWAVDFTNTHIVTMRRHERRFREITSRFDCFVPDGMPLKWCMNLRRAELRDRVYGPTFMRRCVLDSPAPFTHYFLGGSEMCVERLKESFLRENRELRIVGAHHGYFKSEEGPAIIDEINRLSPDFIWVGMGTPRQQNWVHGNKERIRRGIILAVGFAFDVNAGMKKDAPIWLQRLSLTWVHRLMTEPFRLGPRYLRYNTLFLFYLFWDGLRGRVFAPCAAEETGKGMPSEP